jgi:alkanesulfonate monooxygenase SsuD/methylene tetrahydromethanopterin reductase-like flavin-dependent oxidoreductase (luciferase family)
MCRLAGEVAAGVRLHGFCTRRYLDEVILPNLARGAAAAGRALTDIELSGGGFVVTGLDDGAVHAQLASLRQQIAFYGSTPTYRGVLALHGWGDLGEQLTRLARSGQWEAMARAVPDEVVHAFAVVGRYDEIVPRMRERFQGIGRLAFPVPRPDPREEEPVREVLAALREGDHAR